MQIISLAKQSLSVVLLFLQFALIGSLVFSFQPLFTHAAGETAFCELPSPLLVGLKSNDVVTTPDQLTNVIVIENISEMHIGGVTVGVGVFKNEVLSHMLLVADNVTLEPKTTQSLSFDASIGVLPAGEYQYRPFAVQGEIADVLSELLVDTNQRRAMLEKTGEAKELFEITATINDEVSVTEASIDDDSRPLQIVVNTKNISNAPLFEAQVDVVFARGEVPFGTAVQSQVADEAKLFPGSSRTTNLTSYFYNRGPHTLFIFQQVPDTLTPVTILPIQIGSLPGGSYETRLSAVGAVRDGDDVQLTACIEEFRGGEVSKSDVATVQAQVIQSTEYSGEVVSSTEGEPFVSLSAPLVASSTVTTVSLFAIGSDSTNPQNIVQTAELMFDCDRHRSLCNVDTAEAVADFVQEETTQMSFWFYGGIALAGLLLMLLIVKRLEPKLHHHDKHHSEHELH